MIKKAIPFIVLYLRIEAEGSITRSIRRSQETEGGDEQERKQVKR